MRWFFYECWLVDVSQLVIVLTCCVALRSDMEPLDASLLENIEQLEANLVELGPKLKKVRRQVPWSLNA